MKAIFIVILFLFSLCEEENLDGRWERSSININSLEINEVFNLAYEFIKNLRI